MPSRTAVYGVGAATGIVVGLVIARRLGALPGHGRLQRLLGASAQAPAAPTHIVLPDLGPALPQQAGAPGAASGMATPVSPVAPA
jgi:hypothetical protein